MRIRRIVNKQNNYLKVVVVYYPSLIEVKLQSLKSEYRDDEEALQFITVEETEMEMFRKYSDYYGYVFYVLQIE